MNRFCNTIELAIRNLTLHKLRVLLTVLGLIFGVVVGDRDAGDRRGGQPRGPAADRRARRDQHHPPQHQADRRREPVASSRTTKLHLQLRR